MILNERVVLTCIPWAGRIEKVWKDGLYDVALDNGGTAHRMTENDVKREDDKPRETTQQQDEGSKRSKSDKSWPPKGMETKVPTQTGEK